MKKIINLLMILLVIITVSCKEKTLEPISIEEPVKTSKSFTSRISYTQDSTNFYKRGYITLFVDTNSVSTFVGYNIYTQPMGWCGDFTPNNIINTSYKINYTTNNLNKPMGFYIHLYIVRSTGVNNDCSMSGTTTTFIFTKYHVFQEGDNGIINFNSLP